MELVFLRLHLSSRSHDESWVRADVITEVHPRISTSQPYKVIGSRVHLATGRELEVVEAPDEVLELLALSMRRANGDFSSETDSMG